MIRGRAGADCNYSGHGYVKGELNLNPDKNWRIDEVVKCDAQKSDKGQDTYCETGDKYIKFAAGSTCGGCCACADSGGINIEVVASRGKVENPSSVWKKQEDQYTLNKENGEISLLLNKDNSTNCSSEFTREQTYNGILFDTGKIAYENNSRGKLNLEFDKKAEIPVDMKTKYLYAFAEGNIGNVYLDTRKYVYEANVLLNIVYSDNSSVKVTATLPWNWSVGRDYTKENAKTIYLKESPCESERPRALYMIQYSNPYPDKLISSISFEDDFTSDYPRTNILAVTLSEEEMKVDSSDKAAYCLPDNTLIKLPNNPKIYVIKNCKKKWIKTAAEFKRNNYKWSSVKETPKEVVDAYADYLEAKGRLLKAMNRNKIYRIINGRRLWIPTVSSFKSQKLDWGDVEETDNTEIERYPELKLIKAKNDPKVYYITKNGLKRHIINPQVFDLYGNKWEDVVEVSSEIVTSLPEANLIKEQNGYKVYKVEGDKKRWIKSAEAFSKYNYDWSKVVPVNETELKYYEEGEEID